MRSLSTICLFAIITLAAACDKDDVAENPDDFTVSVKAGNYKVNDTIQFDFTGDADIITFYSGEFGKVYNKKDRISEKGVNKLVFQTNMNQGKLVSDDTIDLLISTNLVNYDAAGIAAANWTNITTRNQKWPTALSNTFVTSDSIDITDFSDAEKVNIAFRVITKRTDTAMQRKFQVQNLTLGNKLSDGTYTPLFSNFANIGWAQTSVKNAAEAWDVGEWNVSASNSINNSAGIPIRTAYPITFNPGLDSTGEGNEDWLLTSAVNLRTVKGDAPSQVIKTGVQGQMASFRFIYKTPGTYTATFVATNSRTNGTSQVIRTVTLTVTP
ncbi:DUF5017 domain-containing protein [Paraflavitalea soli]|nr:DUF5017 domain-containing protein [Paraflavitalea soli]